MPLRLLRIIKVDLILAQEGTHQHTVPDRSKVRRMRHQRLQMKLSAKMSRMETATKQRPRMTVKRARAVGERSRVTRQEMLMRKVKLSQDRMDQSLDREEGVRRHRLVVLRLLRLPDGEGRRRGEKGKRTGKEEPVMESPKA